MGIIDRLRIEDAVQRYDFWLELRGARGRQRRALRRELRANLRDAAADIGVTRALFNIGSPKELAYAMTPQAQSRPRWSLGALAASLAFAATAIGMLWTAAVYFEGVSDAGTVGREVSSFVFPWFGSTFHAQVLADGEGLMMGITSPWALLVVPLLVFLVVARPWRALTGRSPRPTTVAG